MASTKHGKPFSQGSKGSNQQGKPNGFKQEKPNIANDVFAGKMRSEHRKASTADGRFGNFKRGK